MFSFFALPSKRPALTFNNADTIQSARQIEIVISRSQKNVTRLRRIGVFDFIYLCYVKCLSMLFFLALWRCSCRKSFFHAALEHLTCRTQFLHWALKHFSCRKSLSRAAQILSVAEGFAHMHRCQMSSFPRWRVENKHGRNPTEPLRDRVP